MFIWSLIAIKRAQWVDCGREKGGGRAQYGALSTVSPMPLAWQAAASAAGRANRGDSPGDLDSRLLPPQQQPKLGSWQRIGHSQAPGKARCCQHPAHGDHLQPPRCCWWPWQCRVSPMLGASCPKVSSSLGARWPTSACGFTRAGCMPDPSLHINISHERPMSASPTSTSGTGRWKFEEPPPWRTGMFPAPGGTRCCWGSGSQGQAFLQVAQFSFRGTLPVYLTGKETSKNRRQREPLNVLVL